MKRSFSSAGLAAILLSACATPLPEPVTDATGLVTYADYTGEYDGFTLVIDERFDEFDSALWQRGDGAVGTESACRFQDQGVVVEDGKLKLMVRDEFIPSSFSNDHQGVKKDYDYSCGELRTNDETRKYFYGRMEARMKAPPREGATGYISSLFTFRLLPDPKSDTPDLVEWEEIDVELEGGRPDKFQANLIYGMDAKGWLDTRPFGGWEDKMRVGPVDEWRVFAIEWLPDTIRWFVDGKLVKTLHSSDVNCTPTCKPPQERPATIPDNPTTIMMNHWIPNDEIQEFFGGNKAGNQYPLVTEYDWFRYFEWDNSEVPEN